MGQKETILLSITVPR